MDSGSDHHSTGHRPGSQVGKRIFTDAEWTRIAGELGLSSRELDIVRLIFDDQIELAIAGELGIAPRTVHTHVERMYRKLEVRDRVQLVLRVTQQFLEGRPNDHNDG